jgi:perosamine synthetase
VAINGYTCYAVFQGVKAAGLEPLYLDVAEGSVNFGTTELEQALKKNSDISAVMIQNTLGIPCDIEGIGVICKKAKLPLIEDLAHSLGMRYPNGVEAGAVGVMSALSFAQYKVIDAVSGGAIVSKQPLKITGKPMPTPLRRRLIDPTFPVTTAVIRRTFRAGIGKPIQKTAAALRLLPKPIEGDASPWHNMTSWHASRIFDGMKLLDKDIARRQNIARIYREQLPPAIQLKHDTESTYVRFPILVEDPQALIHHLKGAGIFVSDIWYDAPVSPIRLIKDTNYKNGQCKNAEYLSKHMVNLPTHIHVDEAAARLIVKEVNSWLQSQQNQ